MCWHRLILDAVVEVAVAEGAEVAVQATIAEAVAVLT